MELADKLVAKWSQLVPADSSSAAKKRKSDSKDAEDGGPKASKRAVVAPAIETHAPAPEIPVAKLSDLPSLTSLSAIAQEAAVVNRPPPLAASSSHIVLAPASQALPGPNSALGDDVVPGIGDPNRYGRVRKGVLINPVNNLVGGHAWERGKRGSIKFPAKDEDMRLIRPFLKTDEPFKVGAAVMLCCDILLWGTTARWVCIWELDVKHFKVVGIVLTHVTKQATGCQRARTRAVLHSGCSHRLAQPCAMCSLAAINNERVNISVLDVMAKR